MATPADLEPSIGTGMASRGRARRPLRPRERVGVGALVAAGLLTGSCGDGAEPERLNVLLITVDTLRADALEPYGAPPGASPALARLASEGVVFEDAQASAPWTLPSFASLMTSQPLSTHGCDRFDSRLQAAFETLPERLLAEGWDTAALVSHIPVGRSHGLDQGFVHFDEEPVLYKGTAEQVVSSPLLTEKALTFLRAQARVEEGRPWLLWLHMFDPHAEYREHPEFSARFGAESDEQRYAGEVAFTDAHVGRVLEALDELGLAERTVVVLVSDHGEEFGDHGGQGHAHSLYAELVHVPLIVRAPGCPARRVEQTVRMIDVYPTLCELLGVPVPAALAGESFLPALRGESLQTLPALAETSPSANLGKSSLVSGPWKLIVDRDQGAVELYDRARDPRELADLAASRPEVVAELRALLEALQAKAREAGRAYGSPGSVELGHEELEALRALGYTGFDQ